MLYIVLLIVFFFFFFKQKTAYEIVDCDWSSDVCSSDLKLNILAGKAVLPIIDLDTVACIPLISLFKGTILNTIFLEPLICPLFTPFTVNLILPSLSAPVAGTFTVLNDVKS